MSTATDLSEFRITPAGAGIKCWHSPCGTVVTLTSLSTSLTTLITAACDHTCPGGAA